MEQENCLGKSGLSRIEIKNYFSRKFSKKIKIDSFCAQANDLCGIVKLPETFSYHNKHIERYGE